MCEVDLYQREEIKMKNLKALLAALLVLTLAGCSSTPKTPEATATPSVSAEATVAPEASADAEVTPEASPAAKN